MCLIESLIPNKKIYFVGIGGVGMSALAHILLCRGYCVSGSDLKETKITKRLKSFGAEIFLGHCAENVGDEDVLVYSSCIQKNNPEIVCAEKKKIKLIQRALLLDILMRDNTAITVTGTHGKTTVTALTAFLLKNAGLNPSYAIGADVSNLGGNAEHGRGKYFVAEADESDGSFLCLHSDCAVITNIDKEHLEYYANMQNVLKAYARFAVNINPQGTLFCFAQDRNVQSILKAYTGRVITYSLESSADIYACNISYCDRGTEFDCIYQGKFMQRFKLQVPGLYNVLNALACIGLGVELKINYEIIAHTLENFCGAERRFQVKRNNYRDVMIVDDYAHHPNEIRAVLKAAKMCKRKRVIGVFQPHRFSRTKFLKEEFGRCFTDTDCLVVTEIYSAFEQPIEGIAGRNICEEVKKNGHKNACFLPLEKVNEHLLRIVRSGDIVMMLGAGTINDLSEQLSMKLSNYAQT
ncbi:MAG: UDP-N-acetylmuramate--L-alanine ligase [Candidatus Omnitrophota bacterium]|nr:MAG: UDP-N-acetylmuramate--L-alanine ligase [Candidatus Omnitrophota bacterium]